MNRTSTQGGYIGLLGILIGASILVFVMVKVYLTPSKAVSELQPNNADGTVPTTQFERNRATIDKVTDITNKQNEQAAETNRLLDNME